MSTCHPGHDDDGAERQLQARVLLWTKRSKYNAKKLLLGILASSSAHHPLDEARPGPT